MNIFVDFRFALWNLFCLILLEVLCLGDEGDGDILRENNDFGLSGDLRGLYSRLALAVFAIRYTVVFC